MPREGPIRKAEAIGLVDEVDDAAGSNHLQRAVAKRHEKGVTEWGRMSRRHLRAGTSVGFPLSDARASPLEGIGSVDRQLVVVVAVAPREGAVLGASDELISRLSFP